MTQTTPCHIADLRVGDLVHAHGALFRVTQQPFDSIGHAPEDPATGWPMGPSGVAVARAICLEGTTPGYFWPGSDWTFQGNTRVKVMREV
jgi:hypothetical protein